MLNSNGFAQGSLVPIAARGRRDRLVGMFFRDTFPIGRIPALIPATWQDGWPTFGNNGVVPVGGIVRQADRAEPEQEIFERQKSIVASDDFANDAPHRAYMDEQWTIPAAARTSTDRCSGSSCWRTPDSRAVRHGVDRQRHGDDSPRRRMPQPAPAALQVSGRTTQRVRVPHRTSSGKVQHSVTYDISAKVKYVNPNSPATKQFTHHRAVRQQQPSRTSRASPRPAASGRRSRAASRFRHRQSLASMQDLRRDAVDGDAADRPRHAPDGLHWSTTSRSSRGARSRPSCRTRTEIAPNGSRLDLPWEWNHAPDNRYWSLTDRDGWLRLTTGKVVTGSTSHLKLANDAELAWLEEARNTLSQRTFGPRQSAETKLDISGMKNGDVAGLAAYNRGFSYVAVKRVDGVNTVGVVNRGAAVRRDLDQAAIETFLPGTTAALGSATEVHLKADLDFARPTGQLWTTFYYSLDGVTWTQLGNRVGPQTLDGSLAHFMGHRVGLFNYATQQAGGHVDFDHYLLSDTLTAQNLPLDTSDLDAAIAYAATLRPGRLPARRVGRRCRSARRGEQAARPGSSAPRTRSTRRSARSATSWPGSACSRPKT